MHTIQYKERTKQKYNELYGKNERMERNLRSHRLLVKLPFHMKATYQLKLIRVYILSTTKKRISAGISSINPSSEKMTQQVLHSIRKSCNWNFQFPKLGNSLKIPIIKSTFQEMHKLLCDQQ